MQKSLKSMTQTPTIRLDFGAVGMMMVVIIVRSNPYEKGMSVVPQRNLRLHISSLLITMRFEDQRWYTTINGNSADMVEKSSTPAP